MMHLEELIARAWSKGIYPETPDDDAVREHIKSQVMKLGGISSEAFDAHAQYLARKHEEECRKTSPKKES